jgi:TatD DNase family protein
MIDTHCHLTYSPLFDRIDNVLKAAADAGVDRMITIGTTPEDAVKAVGLAERHDNLYAAAGLHPHYSEQYQNRDLLLNELRMLVTRPRCVAIGEMGLDRHYPDPPFDVLQGAFNWQVVLIKELDCEGMS